MGNGPRAVNTLAPLTNIIFMKIQNINLIFWGPGALLQFAL